MSWPSGYCSDCKEPCDYKYSWGYEKSHGLEEVDGNLLCPDCKKEKLLKDAKQLKLYILVKESMLEKDFGHTILSIAHAMAAGSRNWSGQEIFENWANESFRKVLCKVTDKQFEKAKTYFPEDEFQVMTECAIDDEELTIVFKPRKDWPGFFRSLKLLK